MTYPQEKADYEYRQELIRRSEVSPCHNRDASIGRVRRGTWRGTEFREMYWSTEPPESQLQDSLLETPTAPLLESWNVKDDGLQAHLGHSPHFPEHVCNHGAQVSHSATMVLTCPFPAAGPLLMNKG